MARIRTIKPEFFTSEDVVSLSPLARLLYVALWCEADREGRMFWKPRTFKLRYFPADQCDIEALSSELVNAGLVVLYEGGELAYIPKFSKHQHINPRESVSTLPDPTEKHASRTRRHASARVSDAQGGREGKGRERKGILVSTPVARSADANDADASAFEFLLPLVDGTEQGVTAEDLSSLSESFPGADVPQQLRQMRMWLAADPARRKTKRGIAKFVVGWLTRVQDRGPSRQTVQRTNDEPEWRREQRERNEEFLGPYAKRKAANVIDMEASDGTARILG